MYKLEVSTFSTLIITVKDQRAVINKDKVIANRVKFCHNKALCHNASVNILRFILPYISARGRGDIYFLRGYRMLLCYGRGILDLY